MRDRLTRALGRPAPSGDDHVRILADVGRLLRIAAEEPKLDDAALLNRLVEGGVERLHAWRLITFVPIAFGRFVLEELNVQAPATYFRRDVRGRDTRRRLRDEPEFRAASDHLGDFSGRPGFNELAVRSAEVNVLNQAMNAGSKPEDLRLIEVVTWESPD